MRHASETSPTRVNASGGSTARILLLVVMLGAAAAGFAAGGNQLNSSGQTQPTSLDPAGLNLFQGILRTPSGLMYDQLPRQPELAGLEGSAWQYGLSIEAGYIGAGGDTGVAAFGEYGDYSEGFILNRFSARLENSGTAYYLRAAGVGIGRDDQYLQLDAGRYGVFGVSLAFDTIPHAFSNRARVLWDGQGTSSLTLPATLTPGTGSIAGVLAALAGRGNSSLSLERERIKLASSYSLSERLRLTLDGVLEWRTGTRPFGGGMNYPTLGQMMETVEPIDYLGKDLTLGLAYSGTAYQLNVTYAGSFFRNRHSALVWENPGLTAFPMFSPERGRIALAPDNDYHRFGGDLAVGLPFWNSRFSTSVSYSRSLQDEELLPPTISTGTVGPPAARVNLDLWNTVNALSRTTADARRDVFTWHSKLTLRPRSNLNLFGEVRYQDQDNDTEYLAFNPLTGEYGYITMDGGPDGLAPGFGGLYDPLRPGSREKYRNIPNATDKLLIVAGADYRLRNGLKVDLEFRRDERRFAHREVSEAIDYVYTLRLVQRMFSFGTARLSYEFLDRDTGTYHSNPYEAFYTSSLPGYLPLLPGGDLPHTLAAMRMYDIAARQSHTLTAKFNLIAGDNMDVQLTGSYREDDYQADFGLTGARTINLNLEWSYHLAENASLYAYYSFQDDSRRQANIKSDFVASNDAAPGGPVYPLQNAWSATADESSHNLGAGLNFTWREVSFDFGYSFVDTSGEFGYEFASPAALTLPSTRAEAGSAFPAQDYRFHLLEADARWPVREDTTLRFLYRYEREDLNDFHYDGLVDPVISNDLFLLAVPEDYRTHVFMLSVEHRF